MTQIERRTSQTRIGVSGGFHVSSHTFQEEYREFLRKHGVEYDERYVWD